MKSRYVMLLWALVFTSSIAVAAQGKSIVKVCVTTELDPSGLRDAAAEARLKAVKEIVGKIESRKGIQIVNSQSEAVIVITVTSAGTEPVWRPTMLTDGVPLEPGAPLPEGTHMQFVARARLRAGTFNTSFAATAQAFHASASKNVARAIDKWFDENGNRLSAVNPAK